jgi:16S rRNA pseudouridine516 synthase
VETEQDIGSDYAATFARGLYFAFEDLTTQPAELVLLGPRTARLSIIEGRYHQVKRMFGHFDNKVVGLHRERMGPLVLDAALAPGEYRALTDDEIRMV